MFNFNFFKSSPAAEAECAHENTNTIAMQQPSSPAAPSANHVVSEQPANQEQMQMQLRGGGGGGICCGLCAGLACFECCEICC
ncbi:hypothetical protein N7466_001808 [Penicillium verhagenii]|uniref:uncharacterized protein n=1 Tax=Penicillium verhagenii TaxID=1562060 RepID=UPI0025456466|nr:uncharacterized protein N7466_001808 [Penicillium verhagenii]KAJ5938674.1 hypothetical protein N7466_001808 [Penicillium verhagenii]